MAQPEKMRRWGGGGGGKGEDRGENKSRAGAPGNVGLTQHIVTLTCASLKAQITGLRWGHLAVSTELLLSTNAYYQHTHTLRFLHVFTSREEEDERDVPVTSS